MHPYQNLELKISQLKQMLQILLQGNVQVAQKTDGVNLMISYRDGKIIAARNKSHLKNSGQNAMTLKQLIQFFDDNNQTVQTIFTKGFAQIKRYLLQMHPDLLKSIFRNGRRFISMQIIYDKSPMTVDYGKSYIIMHSIDTYCKQGTVIKRDMTTIDKLVKYFNQASKRIKQQQFELRPQQYITLKQVKFSKQKIQKFHSQIDLIVGDSNTIGQYLQNRFRKYLQQLDIQQDMIQILTDRWVYGIKDTNLRQIKKHLQTHYSEQIYDKIIKYQQNLNQITKLLLYPIQSVIINAGIQVMSNIRQSLTTNRQKTIQDIKSKLKDSIDYVNTNKKNNKHLRHHIDIINSSGGMNSIAPVQGIVFTFRNVIYKLTGIYGSIHQIIGAKKFDNR